jgi:hypothetical protein
VIMLKGRHLHKSATSTTTVDRQLSTVQQGHGHRPVQSSRIVAAHSPANRVGSEIRSRHKAYGNLHWPMTLAVMCSPKYGHATRRMETRKPRGLCEALVLQSETRSRHKAYRNSAMGTRRREGSGPKHGHATRRMETSSGIPHPASFPGSQRRSRYRSVWKIPHHSKRRPPGPASFDGKASSPHCSSCQRLRSVRP